ncbi:MAG: DUF5317 domain-containing protein, partial [Pseudomonadota bacterium]|nr:DUF5317 domain-containing protein [Pseudomonadota bacterium]
WWQFSLVAALLQVPVYCLSWDSWLLRLSYVLLVAITWANRDRAGGQLLLMGIVCNALPILFHGRMPISLEMLAWGGQPLAAGSVLPMSKDIAVSSSPLLIFGDIIPVHILGWRAAWSFGDVALCFGILKYCLLGAEPKAGPRATTNEPIHNMF